MQKNTMPATEQYAEKYTTALNNLLLEILDFTYKNHSSSHMVSGWVQGQLLRQISLMMQPLRILEIGSFTGFSGLCLAEGLADNGLLYTLEIREADANIAHAYFNRSVLANKIKLLVGDAAQILQTLKETWDLVFIDADKTGYIGYYEQVLPKLRQGGIILADNVLFHGEVLQEPVKGKNAIAMAAFNNHVQSDNRVEQVLLTVRDGIMLIRKK